MSELLTSEIENAHLMQTKDEEIFVVMGVDTIVRVVGGKPGEDVVLEAAGGIGLPENVKLGRMYVTYETLKQPAWEEFSEIAARLVK